MDRSQASASQYPTAVRTAGSASLDLLLPAATGERGEPASAPQTRPALPEASLLRQPQNGRRVGCEPQADPATDAHPGHRSPLSQTELEPSGARTRSVPVPVAGCRDRETKPRMEYRYHIHSDAWRLSLPGRRNGLVQPLRTQLGTLQHDGDRLLPGRAPRRVPLRPTRNLELRSGLAVHLGRFPGPTQASRHLHQYGWPRTRARQCIHRTLVALAQVRADLPRRLRHRPRTVSGIGRLLPLLQSRAPAPGTRLPNAGRSVPTPKQKEQIIFIMGALPPNPRDLSLFSSRMDIFLFTGIRTCRTI